MILYYKLIASYNNYTHTHTYMYMPIKTLKTKKIKLGEIRLLLS